MTIYAIIITLFALLMWWRKRVWKRRFMALVSTEGKRVRGRPKASRED